MMEEEQLLQSPDPGDSITRDVKTEEEKDICLRSKEEEIPLQISPDPGDSTARNMKTEKAKEEEIPLHIGSDPGDSVARNMKTEKAKEEEIPQHIGSDPGDSIVSNVKTEEMEYICVRIKEEEINLQISSDTGDSIARNMKTETAKEDEIPLHIGSDSGDSSIVTNVKIEEEEEGILMIEEAKIPLDISSDNRSTKRKSYSVEYKKWIVENSQGKNLTAFCEEHKLDLRMVRKWRSEYDNLSHMMEKGHAKRLKCGSGRQSLLIELEAIICEWIADKRAKALVVRRADIQAFALGMAPHISVDLSSANFKASQAWLDGFLRRYDLSLKRSTTLFKLEDTEIIKRALAFKSFVDNIDFTKYQLSNMIAMDETAVYMGQGSQMTIDQRGGSSIYIPSTGYECAPVSCILAIRLDGKKVPPLIITRGKKEKIDYVSGIYVLETEKAWCTQAVIRKWVDLMFPCVLRGAQRGLLVWDSASTHRAKDMKNFLKERGIDQIMIPAGMTAYLQTLDLAINKPFKDHLRIEVNDYIENRMDRNQWGNFVKPKLQEVVTWVKNSWDKITESCVANALRAGYLDKRCSFKESSIAAHERLGSLILKELESKEFQEGIAGSDMESYDDILEEDDMIVFE